MSFGLSFQDFGKKMGVSLFDPDLIIVFFIIDILFYPQSAFYPCSAVCSLHFTPCLQSAFYTDRSFYDYSLGFSM